jgi:hypothetical protein
VPSREQRLAVWAAISAFPGLVWAIVVGVVATVEVRNLHGRPAENLVFK